jgi:uncharacterized oligopeptide transporter (OPT) family protein
MGVYFAIAVGIAVIVGAIVLFVRLDRKQNERIKRRREQWGTGGVAGSAGIVGGSYGCSGFGDGVGSDGGGGGYGGCGGGGG